MVEFTISLTASLLADLVERKVPTGLYCTGSVSGRPIVHPAGRGVDLLPAMLQSLALASPHGRASMPGMLSEEVPRLRNGTSIMIVATDYPEPLNLALAEARRRMPVVAVWVDAGTGSPPDPGVVDVREEVRYHDDWRTLDVLEIS